MWRVDPLPTGEIHVYPMYGRTHFLDQFECWCHPEPDERGEEVIVHNVEH